MILVVPMGMLNFDSNVSIQVGKMLRSSTTTTSFNYSIIHTFSLATFCITVAIVTEWIIASIVSYATAGNPVSNCDFPSLPNSIPVIQPSGIGNLIGTILLSVGFTFVVPSWINAKVKNGLHCD